MEVINQGLPELWKKRLSCGECFVVCPVNGEADQEYIYHCCELVVALVSRDAHIVCEFTFSQRSAGLFLGATILGRWI